MASDSMLQVSLPPLVGAAILPITTAGNINDIVLNRRGLERLFLVLATMDSRATHATFSLFMRLPVELQAVIMDLAVPLPASYNPFQLPPMNSLDLDPARNPAIPPLDRSRRLITRLPAELIREIIAESLPAKDSIIKCLCGHAPEKKADCKPTRNRVSDLMTVCKKFKEVVKLAVYQERSFELHIHQGGTGGIELLNTGCQPLAYMEPGIDDRFVKFTGNDEYGFQHMKKINISIFPSTDSKRSKAVTLNTYFLVQALCRLFERGAEDKERLASITVAFPGVESNTDIIGRHSIMAESHYWRDPTSHMPRTSSLHGMSDIEMVLHPLARLTGVHNVNIILPTEVMNHTPTKNFVERLTAVMKSKSVLPTLLLSEEQENIISSMRQEVEDYLFAKKFGRCQVDIEKIGEKDMEADEYEEDFLESAHEEDDDGFKRADLKRALDASIGRVSRAGNAKRRMMDDSGVTMTSGDDNDQMDCTMETESSPSTTQEERDEQTALMEAYSGFGHGLSDSAGSVYPYKDDIPLTGLVHRQHPGHASTSESSMRN